MPGGAGLNGPAPFAFCAPYPASALQVTVPEIIRAGAMDQSEFVFLYSTFPDAESAAKPGALLVANGLAACVNIHAPMTSIYKWDGKLETASEVAAFIKTRRALVTQAVEAVTTLHPYGVPCFLVLPIEGGSEDYLAWARTQTTIL